MMHIEIHHNELRMLGKSFMVGVNTKEQKLVKHAKYRIEHKKYGELGIAECVYRYTKHLHEIKPVESLTICGTELYISEEQKEGAMKMDVYHLGVFRYIRRNDEAFEKLLKDLLPKAGININVAQSLF